MSVQTLEAAILDTLGTIDSVTVYPAEVKILRLPAVTLDFIGLNQQIEAMSFLYTTYQWNINLYVSLDQDAKAALDQTKAFMESIKTALNSNWNLNGAAVESLITAVAVNKVTETEKPYYLCQIQFQAKE